MAKFELSAWTLSFRGWAFRQRVSPGCGGSGLRLTPALMACMTIGINSQRKSQNAGQGLEHLLYTVGAAVPRLPLLACGLLAGRGGIYRGRAGDDGSLGGGGSFFLYFCHFFSSLL